MLQEYARERLHAATMSLATGEARLKERLESAALSISRIDPDRDLSPRHCLQFMQLLETLTAKYSFKATIQSMSEVEARNVATLIVDFYVRLRGGI